MNTCLTLEQLLNSRDHTKKKRMKTGRLLTKEDVVLTFSIAGREHKRV
jgi:hypothetical protein